MREKGTPYSEIQMWTIMKPEEGMVYERGWSFFDRRANTTQRESLMFWKKVQTSFLNPEINQI